MFNIFIENLKIVGMLYMLLLVVIITYSLAGYSTNKENKKETFDLKMFLNGIFEKTIEGMVYVGLTVVISFVPTVIKMSGLSIQDSHLQVLSLAAIVMLLFTQIYNRFVATIEKLKEKNNVHDLVVLDELPIATEEPKELEENEIIDVEINE